MKKLATDEALLKKANDLGVITDGEGSFILPGVGEVPFRASAPEIQRRIIEAERHRREKRFLIVSVVSAVFSTMSAIAAIAAWVAVYYK